MTRAALAAETAGAGHDIPFYAEPEMWLLVAFALFVGTVARPAWRALTGALDARAAAIEAGLEEARKLREEAQAALASYQRKQRDAVKEANALLAHAEEESRRVAAHAEKALAETLARREALADERIAAAEARALDEVRAEAVEIALAATRRILAERIDETKGEALLDDAIKELPGKLR